MGVTVGGAPYFHREPSLWARLVAWWRQPLAHGEAYNAAVEQALGRPLGARTITKRACGGVHPGRCPSERDTAFESEWDRFERRRHRREVFGSL